MGDRELKENETEASLILTLETLAANAWPAAENRPLGGWRLRATQGVTRRANSVWPNATEAGIGLAEKLLAVEDFYRQRGQPARYQICPAMQPLDLDERLAAQGYCSVARTAVQVTALQNILRQTAPLRSQPSFVVELSETFDEEWFAAYCAVEHNNDPANPVRRAILQRIAPTTGFVTLRIEDEIAAVGLGVLEAQWLGIFCMATQTPFRRRGAANAILRTLAIWAQMNGATHAYLQVMEENQAAQTVYTRVGFVTLYHYHYREKALRNADEENYPWVSG
jgi:GNAT superfamily N-acetyltransferase